MGSDRVKRRLLRNGIFQNQCQICGIAEWVGKPIQFELHHIDGNNKNNDISNLQLLCPNCHSQTPNFRGRNIKKKTRLPSASEDQIIEAIKSSYNRRQVLVKLELSGVVSCYVTLNEFLATHDVSFKQNPAVEKRVEELNNIDETYEKTNEKKLRKQYTFTKITWPPKEELEELLSNNPCIKVAKQLGVSDGAVRKRAKKYGLVIEEISKWAHKHNPRFPKK